LAAASFASLAEMFLHRVASTPDSEAFSYPDRDEVWQSLSWSAVSTQVFKIASGLHALGLALEDRVAIMAGTRVEWVLADLGILLGGCATTTVYPNTKAEDCLHILRDADVRLIFVEGESQVNLLRGLREQLPGLLRVVNLSGEGKSDGWCIHLAELMEQGAAWNKAHPGEVDARARAVRGEHLATLIYTSGTTGKPKGVELTHDCWVFEAEAMDALGFLTPADKQFLWLPLAHSFGKVLLAAVVRIGIPTAIDGRLDRILPNMAAVKPTFVAAVPRIFEKLYNGILTKVRQSGGLKHKIFRWATEVGRQGSAVVQQGKTPSGLLAFKLALAERAVFADLKARFGGRLRFFISGSAPLSRELAEFFHAAGILILEGYGLTETSAASFVNRIDKFRFGTVGVPLPGVQVRIDPADGEVLLAGRGVMRGYRNLPEQNAESLGADGWYRTGDIGHIDADGFLKITDRKKDLIKTSGGKYVAPQEIEGRLKAASPLISQVLVHGNNRNFCVALITIDEAAARAIAAEKGKEKLSYAELTRDVDVLGVVKAAVDSLNQSLARYETIKNYAVLEHDLSVEEGDLTPSQKMKRKAIEHKHKALLDEFYAGAGEGP
jgi:long-chain acyl-CoA synthetase